METTRQRGRRAMIKLPEDTIRELEAEIAKQKRIIKAMASAITGTIDAQEVPARFESNEECVEYFACYTRCTRVEGEK